MSEEERIAKATGIVGTATLLSRILGYARDMVIAYFFGAGIATDAFFVAFRIPNTLRRLFGEGSLTVSFIPVFSEYLHNKEQRDWDELVNGAFTGLSILLAGVSILGVFCSPWLIRVLAPGFVDPEQFGMTVINYMTGVRIEHAKRLLLTTDKNCTEICCETGYNNQSYFTRTFKELVGMTPRKFRDSNHRKKTISPPL